MHNTIKGHIWRKKKRLPPQREKSWIHAWLHGTVATSTKQIWILLINAVDGED
jgi:hypothetical protein